MMFSKTKRLLSPTPFLERPALFQRHSDSASAFTTSPYAGAQCDDTAYFTYFTPGILELSLFTQVFFLHIRTSASRVYNLCSHLGYICEKGLRGPKLKQRGIIPVLSSLISGMGF